MKNIVNQLVSYGQVERGQLGVVVHDLDRKLAKVLGTKDHLGAVIAEVIYGSPADLAGLQAGDVITHINGKKIKGANDVRNKVGTMRVGTRVNIDAVRKGSVKNVTAVVGKTQTSLKSRNSSRQNRSDLPALESPFWDQ